ncbi:unnamed protein product [Sphagnum jensenii]
MIPPMVTARTVIVVVPLTILVSGHEADASRAGFRCATYGTDTITFNDPLSILFVSVERAATPRPVMKRMLLLWAVGCQLVALTASLSPSQETDLKIVMSTTFTIIQMSTVRPLIGYVVDEVADVDNEIIRQLIEWDCDVSSEMDRAMVYCLT